MVTKPRILWLLLHLLVLAARALTDGAGGAGHGQAADGGALTARQLAYRLAFNQVDGANGFVSTLGGFATANATFDCNLCDRKFIFVIGTGRSGSTTVMQMVNELPGHFITGEHNGQMFIWRDMMAAQQVKDDRYFCMVQDWVFRHSRDPADTVTAAAMKHHTSARAIIAYENEVSPVRGFKEIRYTSLEILRWLKQVFPCSKMVINIREPDALVESREKAFGHVNEGWARAVIQNLTDFHAERLAHNDTFWLPLESFSVDTFNAMAAWMGVGHCRFVSIAKNRGQGSKNRFRNPKHIRCWDRKWDREVSAYFERVKELKEKKEKENAENQGSMAMPKARRPPS